MEIEAKSSVRKPTHPGAILREDIIPNLSISKTEFAKLLGTTRQNLHRILAEKTGISAEMSLRLGKICGNGYSIWIGMQSAIDLYEARERLGNELDKIPTLLNPYS